jgi:hypothetical protein
MLTIPPFYRPPHGIPLYWADEVSGILPAAVKAYLDHRIEGAPITDDQMRLVREFFVHYINAPCWEVPSTEPEYIASLLHLREQAFRIKGPGDASRFIEGCLDLGLDPL